MNTTSRRLRVVWMSFVVVASLFGMSAGVAIADEIKVALTGDQEVPGVSTSAKGTGAITVSKDHTVRGSITTSGVQGTMAHIHVGAVGKSGPPIITLTKTAENVWSVPAGTKLTDEQYKSYEAGDLYVNVHSDAHKSGEIRGQLKP